MQRLALSVLVGLSMCSIAWGAGKAHRSITWGFFKASGPKLKQIGWMAVRHAKNIESSAWSVGCETLDRDQARFSVYKDYVGELGAKHARLQSGWAKCEKQKGLYDFAWLDECVYGLSEQGVEPWICLCYGNPIYKSTVHLGSTLGPIVHSEEAMAAWLKYVDATVRRYHNVVTAWEIWNEPFGQSADYATMVLVTAELIRRIQPDAAILVTAIGEADRAVVLKMLKDENMLQSFGLIRSNLLHEFIYKRPVYYAVQHMMSFFDDAVKPVGLLEYESDSPRQLTVAGFEKAGTAVTLLWYSDQVPNDKLAWDQVDLTIERVTFHDPVYVEMITGKVFALDRSAWKREGENTALTQLPVWDSPIMLAERTQVELRKAAR
jgi:hypothetical protein